MLLLFTIIGEFLLPLILERYYKGYDGKTMVMSALGSPQSPVRVIYLVWRMDKVLRDMSPNNYQYERTKDWVEFFQTVGGRKPKCNYTGNRLK